MTEWRIINRRINKKKCKIELLFAAVMLDQTFSLENFTTIFDIENRKGNSIQSIFKDEPNFLDIYNKDKEIKLLRKVRKGSPDYKNALTKLKNEKKDLVAFALSKISREVNDKHFSISITEDKSISTKPVYKIGNDAKSFFVMKQLQYNLRKLYKVKQANRFAVINQLANILDSNFPIYIFRTDLSEFYERISQKKVIDKLRSDALLSPMSLKIISSIFHQYNSITKSNRGLPRGIGISAYLSEVYARVLDNKLQSVPHVIYYARYVDDIIIVFAKHEGVDYSIVCNGIKEDIEKEDFTVNVAKTIEPISSSSTNYSFEYLGYGFKRNNSQLEIRMSREKGEKYKLRIKTSFELYNKRASFNEKLARKLLVKQVRYLTRNVRLINNKNNVYIGIYHSNSMVNKLGLDCIRALDHYLLFHVNSLPNPLLKERLKKYKFIDGFADRKFTKFDVEDFRVITKDWKNV